jgi:hypothetical protein
MSRISRLLGDPEARTMGSKKRLRTGKTFQLENAEKVLPPARRVKSIARSQPP